MRNDRVGEFSEKEPRIGAFDGLFGHLYVSRGREHPRQRLFVGLFHETRSVLDGVVTLSFSNAIETNEREGDQD